MYKKGVQMKQSIEEKIEKRAREIIATRIRALKMYNRHNQTSAIDLIHYVIEKFPFRIHTVRTDRGHEFQAKFHWYVEDKGMRHVYIKPRSPQLNGKVERSHRTDQEEFYQLLTYSDDVDLNKKLEAWCTSVAFSISVPFEVADLRISSFGSNRFDDLIDARC
jgi:transposase InsO family protein